MKKLLLAALFATTLFSCKKEKPQEPLDPNCGKVTNYVITQYINWPPYIAYVDITVQFNDGSLELIKHVKWSQDTYIGAKYCR